MQPIGTYVCTNVATCTHADTHTGMHARLYTQSHVRTYILHTNNIHACTYIILYMYTNTKGSTTIPPRFQLRF